VGDHGEFPWAIVKYGHSQQELEVGKGSTGAGKTEILCEVLRVLKISDKVAGSFGCHAVSSLDNQDPVGMARATQISD
jgi:hypothetical protein